MARLSKTKKKIFYLLVREVFSKITADREKNNNKRSATMKGGTGIDISRLLTLSSYTR